MFDGRKLGDLLLDHTMSEPGPSAHFGEMWRRLQFHAIIQQSRVSLSSTGTCGRKHPRANWCQLLIWLCSTLYSEVHLWGRADRLSASFGIHQSWLPLSSALKTRSDQETCVQSFCVFVDVCCEAECYRGEAGCFLSMQLIPCLQSSSSWHDAMA